MRSGLVLLALLFSAPDLLAEETAVKATIKTETYGIAGETGPALYAAIGQKGPLIRGGKVRTIAYTDFKLTWQRRYENQGGACVLAAARPHLTIIYRLPKPTTKLSPAVRENWNRFAAGVIAHERQHGDFILEMVRHMVEQTVGLSAANDPDCQKVRSELTRRLGPAFRAKSRKDANFDKVEMSEGGTVRRLVMALVNGA